LFDSGISIGRSTNNSHDASCRDVDMTASQAAEAQ